MEANWIVLQGEADNADGGLWMSATPFADLDDAKKFVEQVVREEWGVRVPEQSEESVEEKNLADMKGYWIGDSQKYSWAHYSEDGMEAWVRNPATLDPNMKIKVVRLLEEGKRAC